MEASSRGALSRQSMGRLLAALFVLGALVAMYSIVLPPPPLSVPLVVVDAGLALAVGVVSWFLPWERWPRTAPLALMVSAFPMIALYNHLATAEPYRFGVFFVLCFVWTGLSQRRGMSLAMTPVFVVAYLAPLVTTGTLTPTSAASMLFVGPAAIFMGEAISWISSSLRSAEQKLYESMEHSALHDPLTQLANRALFGDRVAHAAMVAERRGHSIDVLFIDLDDFKAVNDSLGHGAGDDLLQAVGQRLIGCLRSSDTVARLGGDEFAVLLESPLESTDAARAAQRIQDALRPPFPVHGRSVSVSASIGIASGGGGLETSEDIMRSADIAMYRAKAAGKNGYQRFEPSMRELADRELELRSALPSALARGEFFLQYQPIVELSSLRIVGVEALIRWQRPGVGAVPPLDFMPMADEIGLGHELRDWVLRTGCAQMRQWDLAAQGRKLTLSVNVSARQLQQSTLASEIRDVLASESLFGERLLVEITEHELFDDLEMGLRSIRALRNLGVRIAVDDFGTGYSSLSYLHQLPVDTLKIDRSFTALLSGSAPISRVGDAIVTLGTSLGFDLIAEGIERPEQLDRLRKLKCRLGQGYLLARPMEADAVGELLARGKVRVERQGASGRAVVGLTGARKGVQPAT